MNTNLKNRLIDMNVSVCFLVFHLSGKNQCARTHTHAHKNNVKVIQSPDIYHASMVCFDTLYTC